MAIINRSRYHSIMLFTMGAHALFWMMHGHGNKIPLYRQGNTHRGSQRAAVVWRLYKLVMAVTESAVDSKYSNNTPEIPLRMKESRWSNHEEELSIKVLSLVSLALHFPGSPRGFSTVSPLLYRIYFFVIWSRKPTPDNGRKLPKKWAETVKSSSRLDLLVSIPARRRRQIGEGVGTWRLEVGPHLRVWSPRVPVRAHTAAETVMWACSQGASGTTRGTTLHCRLAWQVITQHIHWFILYHDWRKLIDRWANKNDDDKTYEAMSWNRPWRNVWPLIGGWSLQRGHAVFGRLIASVPTSGLEAYSVWVIFITGLQWTIMIVLRLLSVAVCLCVAPGAGADDELKTNQTASRSVRVLECSIKDVTAVAKTFSRFVNEEKVRFINLTLDANTSYSNSSVCENSTVRNSTQFHAGPQMKVNHTCHYCLIPWAASCSATYPPSTSGGGE